MRPQTDTVLGATWIINTPNNVSRTLLHTSMRQTVWGRRRGTRLDLVGGGSVKTVGHLKVHQLDLVNVGGGSRDDLHLLFRLARYCQGLGFLVERR